VFGISAEGLVAVYRPICGYFCVMTVLRGRVTLHSESQSCCKAYTVCYKGACEPSPQSPAMHDRRDIVCSQYKPSTIMQGVSKS